MKYYRLRSIKHNRQFHIDLDAIQAVEVSFTGGSHAIVGGQRLDLFPDEAAMIARVWTFNVELHDEALMEESK